MSFNTFGKLFRFTTWGESHGPAIGCIIDGCPPLIQIKEQDIQKELDRRKPGQSKVSSSRKEDDKVQFLSGIFEGKSTGTPIGFLIPNINSKSKDYNNIKDVFRPSHADYTYEEKYGIRDYRGGGRSSARETACRVVAGSIAKQLLNNYGIKISAYVSSIGNIFADEKNMDLNKDYDSNIVRCPDNDASEKMINLITELKSKGNTVGGQIKCIINGVKPGLGEPVFDKLHADLGKAMLSINAVKGFEYGSGFNGSKMTGSEHNDEFTFENGNVSTKTNNSGGIQGGISNGEEIYFKVAFKPVATIMSKQNSIDKEKNNVELSVKGRHDPCVVPRAVPIVESMAAIVLADHLLRNRTSKL